jgi:hypothetical protein
VSRSSRKTKNRNASACLLDVAVNGTLYITAGGKLYAIANDQKKNGQ